MFVKESLKIKSSSEKNNTNKQKPIDNFKTKLGSWDFHITLN